MLAGLPNFPEDAPLENFGGENLAAPFARASEATRNFGPATDGLRASTKKNSKLTNDATWVKFLSFQDEGLESPNVNHTKASAL